MTLSKNKVVLSVVLSISIGYAIAYFTKPEKVVTVEHTVVKQVEVQSKHNNIVTVVTTAKDGTVVSTTKDTSITDSNNSTVVDSSKSSTVTNRSIGVRIRLAKDIRSANNYSLAIDSPPMLSLWKVQAGLTAGVANDVQHITGNVGLFIQF